MGKRKQTHRGRGTTATAAVPVAGASNASKRQRQKWSSSHKKKQNKQRHQKFWIQDCPDLVDPDAALFQPTSESGHDGSSVPPLSTTPQHLLVYITAAYLQDDHPKLSACLGTDSMATTATAAATPTTLTSEDDSKSFPTDRVDGKDDNDPINQRATAVVVDSTLVDSTLLSPPAVSSAHAVAITVASASSSAARKDDTAADAVTVDETEPDDGEKSSGDLCVVASTSPQPFSSSSTDSPVIYIQRRHDVTTSSSFASTNTGTKSNNQSTLTSFSTKPFRHLPHGDNGDGIVNPHQDVPDKYWAQRKRLFAKFDDGIQLDADGWFSVTPEAIATHIAERLTLSATTTTSTTTTLSVNGDSNLDAGTVNNNDGLVVLDAFGGVGGNAIAFALCPTVDLVVCVDTCMDRLQLAAHNCRVYNVPVEKVLFVHGNACQVLECYRQGTLHSLPQSIAKTEHPLPSASSPTNAKVDASNNDSYTFGGYESLPPRLDVIFLSPPWGGPQYRDIGPRHFGLSNIQLLSGAEATAPNEAVDNDCHDGGNNVTNQGVNQCNDKVSSTEHGTMDSGHVDGVALLRLAVNALAADRLQIGYYLPRNLNGLTFAQDCYTACNIRGTIEMEQNVLNDKLKTITVYIRGDER